MCQQLSSLVLAALSINLSGIEVFVWWDDELFRRVKDRKTGREFMAIVASPPCSTHCRKFRWLSDVCGLKGTPARQHRTCQDGDVECVPLHRGCTDHPQHVHAVGFGCCQNFPSLCFNCQKMHVTNLWMVVMSSLATSMGRVGHWQIS